MSVKNRLKEIRMQEYMMSQKEFAKFIDINYRQYNKYEHDGIIPYLEVALKIARKLNKQVEDIFYLDE